MNNILSILDIAEDTTVDGPGFRTSIYAAGCPHRCPGCHNPQSWVLENGSLWTIDAIMEKIKQAECSNVTFSGGDPLMQAPAFTELAKRIRTETNKTIWCYTGYLYEDVLASPELSQILPYIDILVDGLYIENFRDESLHFKGSSNQRIINVSASLLTLRSGIAPNEGIFPYLSGYHVSVRNDDTGR
ncbi:MAG: Anaerobic ribonucleoside-triphosphate reductase-activating protein [Candidatus Ordinivivax streblomastigis]|uniref:Anaerobic ribonucleoside-triphosphate reductase-activating protein n=1 Tax=Candidatus Ordinivivax streblomastigis TaxID=2540710 RepID=A0A5M8NX84_9BACT|nr:MAG: Anaerobic ribonucleoside-triphosphate reductase-activating protein [Candidatus Ordinivivax streblomastigis]